MTVRVGINGFGRIGRLVLRAGWNTPEIDFCHINEIKGGAKCAAHLLEFDSVQGRFEHHIHAHNDKITLDGHTIGFSEFDTPEGFDWGSKNIDIVLECSGQFRSTKQLEKYFQRKVNKVIVAAPVKTAGALNIVYGINHKEYDPDRDHILTAASCTTNCIAPIIKVVHENFKIKHGSITTIHNVTNTQVMVDAPHADLRRARSGLNSLIPTTTGSATAITLIYPELEGRLDGHAVRVPTLTGSMTDCVFEIERASSAREINSYFEAASKSYLEGILGLEHRPLVSSDYVGDPRSAIVDAPSTLVVDSHHLKVFAWYDNEWGYANRMIDITRKVAKYLENQSL